MILSFSVKKEIIQNDNSWVVISWFKVGKKEFLQTLQPIDKVEQSYCHYQEMLYFEKSPGEVVVYDENSSFEAVKKC